GADTMSNLKNVLRSFLPVASPKNLAAIGKDLSLELLKVVIKSINYFLLNTVGSLAKVFPFRYVLDGLQTMFQGVGGCRPIGLAQTRVPDILGSVGFKQSRSPFHE